LKYRPVANEILFGSPHWALTTHYLRLTLQVGHLEVTPVKKKEPRFAQAGASRAVDRA